MGTKEHHTTMIRQHFSYPERSLLSLEKEHRQWTHYWSQMTGGNVLWCIRDPVSADLSACDHPGMGAVRNVRSGPSITRHNKIRPVTPLMITTKDISDWDFYLESPGYFWIKRDSARKIVAKVLFLHSDWETLTPKVARDIELNLDYTNNVASWTAPLVLVCSID